MALFKFSQVLVFVILSGICLPCLRAENDVSDFDIGQERNKAFGTVASGVVLHSDPYHVPDKPLRESLADAMTDEESRKEVGEAAEIVFSLAWAHGVGAIPRSFPIDFLHNRVAELKVKDMADLLNKYNSEAISEMLYKEYLKRTNLEKKDPFIALSTVMDDELKFRKDSAKSNVDPVHWPKEVMPSLGCTFDDVNTYSYSQPNRWANKTVPPLIFTSNDAYFKFIDALRETIPSVLQSTPYNDIDHFLRFVSEYKYQKSKSLEDFYESYKVKFQPHDTIVYELNLIQQFEKVYPGATKHFFLVTVFKDNEKDFKNRDYEKMANELPKHHFFGGHVAGAFNFVLNNIRGYVIVDLTLGVNVPIIVMENGQIPPEKKIKQFANYVMNFASHRKTHHDTIPLGAKNTITYRLRTQEESGNEFVTARVTNPGEQCLTTHVYWVRRPYCGFLEYTYKANLLRPGIGMFAWAKDAGIKRGRVILKLAPKAKLEPEGSEHALSFTNAEGKEQLIPDATYESLASELEVVLATISGENEAAFMEVLGKIIGLKVLVLDDDKFLEEFYELYCKNKVHDKASSVEFNDIPWSRPIIGVSDQSRV